MQHLQPNTTLQGGKYRIERVLGQGGFGITYLAEQEMLGRKVAVKEFFMRECCDRAANKFISEAQTIAKFHHPNIINIYDVFLENNTAYYVMEYIDGQSLEDVIRLKGSLPEDKAIDYICQIGAAVDNMHKQKINHLDIKPSNIMLRRSQDEVVLIDFGISKLYDNTGNELTTTLVGISEGYAPLEQYQRGALKKFCAQTDIYALGATLYKLVTGKTPPSIHLILSRGLQLPSNISPNTRMAITEAMQVTVGKRTKDAKSFIAQLSLNQQSRPNVPKKKVVKRTFCTKPNTDEDTLLSLDNFHPIIRSLIQNMIKV